MQHARPPKSEVEQHLVALSASNQSKAEQLLADFREVLAVSKNLIDAILQGAKSGSWSIVAQDMAKLRAQPAFQKLQALADSLQFKSIGLVGGAEVSFIISGKGLAGALTDTRNAKTFYAYASLGLSVGASEGGEGVVGLYVSSEVPSEAGGAELFAALQGDVGVGAAVEVFTNPGSWLKRASGGMVILVSTGEEVDASLGVGYAWVNAI